MDTDRVVSSALGADRFRDLLSRGYLDDVKRAVTDLIDGARYIHLEPGQQLELRQGEFALSLGQASCMKVTLPTSEGSVAELGRSSLSRGALVGFLGALAPDHMRTANLTAVSPMDLLAPPKDFWKSSVGGDLHLSIEARLCHAATYDAALLTRAFPGALSATVPFRDIRPYLKEAVPQTYFSAGHPLAVQGPYTILKDRKNIIEVDAAPEGEVSLFNETRLYPFADLRTERLILGEGGVAYPFKPIEAIVDDLQLAQLVLSVSRGRLSRMNAARAVQQNVQGAPTKRKVQESFLGRFLAHFA